MPARLTPIPRRHARQQLVLKVEFDDAAGFRSSYLSDVSEGGLRLNTQMAVGERVLLNISFLGFVEPIQIEADVKWTLPEGHPEGPASGLAFIDPSPEARAWLQDVLDASTQIYIGPETPSRVILLENQPFLQDVYGQEVRNWAELCDVEPLELIALADPEAWLTKAHGEPATLGIVDVDELAVDALGLYDKVRGHSVSGELPLIILGTPGKVEPFEILSDDLLLCLRKPLRFGVLMNTVRLLARPSD